MNEHTLCACVRVCGPGVRLNTKNPNSLRFCGYFSLKYRNLEHDYLFTFDFIMTRKLSLSTHFIGTLTECVLNSKCVCVRVSFMGAIFHEVFQNDSTSFLLYIEYRWALHTL